MRLRRRQKWVFLALAIVFAATFAGVGVGSGSGGLSQLYSGLFGGGSGTSVSKAQNEIKTDPAKGYRDLANAYIAQNNIPAAVGALQSYLKVNKKDAGLWSELGGLEQQQGDNAVTAYQNVQQASSLANPASAITPSGPLGQQLGTNPIDQSNSQQLSAQAAQLSQQATSDYAVALNAYKTTAKLQPHNAEAQFSVATAAERANNLPLAIKSLQKYLNLDPHTPNAATIISACKQMGGKCSVPKSKK